MSLRLRDWSLTAKQKKQQNEQIRQKLAMGLSPEARQYFYQSMLPAIEGKVSQNVS
jgi:tryptophanyl-tRNA synthetase